MIVNESIVVFLNAFLHLLSDIGALDVVNEVVVELTVTLDVEHANGVFAVRLDKIHPIAVLVGLVDVGDGARLAEGVEHVATEREHWIVNAECREDGKVEINLLDQLIATERLDLRRHVERHRDGIHPPDVAVLGHIMLAVGIVGSDDEQGAVEPRLFFGFGKEVAKGTVGIINSLLETAPEIALLGQFNLFGRAQ